MKKGSAVEDQAGHAVQTDGDASTRQRILRSILHFGPSTTTELAERLALTPAAVRRHLSDLSRQGHLDSLTALGCGTRGRGRPARLFVLTDKGRSDLPQSYDELAIRALRYLEETAGTQAVAHFAEQLVAGLEHRLASHSAAGLAAGESAAVALAQALSAEGYVAFVRTDGTGQQLCQNHCPVAHVAAQFPELCEAETRVFARILRSHVHRVTTIAHGDAVCTIHVPPSAPSGSSTGKAAHD